jgi:DNA-directed RNA polymerase subunit M/transcription elongation factor TFIIS
VKDITKLKDFTCPKCGKKSLVSSIDMKDMPDDPDQFGITVLITCEECQARWGFGRRFEKEKK